MPRLLSAMHRVLNAVGFAVTVPLMYPVARLRRSPRRPWVISGHRGRIYADNAGALHAYIRASTGQQIMWIGADPGAGGAESFPVLRRGSVRARWAIIQAPVLIYSHGEDDLDPLAILLRRALGLRVFLNHSMNHLKAGQMHRADLGRMQWLKRKALEWSFVDFDVLLASSIRERENFALSFPAKTERLRLGGGAHLDAILARREGGPRPVIYYLPTFRDTEAGREGLVTVMRELVASEALGGWLAERGWEFHIGWHINSGDLESYGVHLRAPFVARPLSSIVDDLTGAAVFISDYSGLLLDFLAMGRPLIYFPFDLEDYLKTRRFYVDYDELASGPVVHSVEALIEALRSGAFEQEAWRAKRERWREECIPSLEPGYAAESYNAICQELAGGRR